MMSFNLIFRLAESKKDIIQVTNLISPRPLNYKGYSRWLEKAVEELHFGQKQAGLAFSEEILVGSAIFQPHKYIMGISELKLVRTLSEFQRRLISSCLVRQVEWEVKNQGSLAMIGDARSDRTDVANFLLISGYRNVVSGVDLYNEGQEDSVFFKPFYKEINVDFKPHFRRQ